MATVHDISVTTRKPSLLRVVARNAVLWGFLVGSVGLSRIWFGGAFVIDLFVFVIAFMWAITQALRSTGFSADMTKSEMSEWVKAGMPDDVKAWREGRS